MLQITIWILSCLAVATETTEYNEEDQGHTSFPAIPSDATNILLKSNAISSISTSKLSSFYQLVKLDLEENHLTEFPDLSPIKLTLQDLNLQKNDITLIDGSLVSELTKLKTLNLQWNFISSFPDVSVPLLEKLFLKFNPIRHWPTFGGIKGMLKQLTIDIKDEQELSADKFEGFTSLELLTIQSSSLEIVPDFTHIVGTLQRLQIENFNLKNAPIEHLAILGNLASLTLLTGVSQIPPVCSGISSWVNIWVNPFDPCDCKMIWMKKVVEAGGYVAVNPSRTCRGTQWYMQSSQQLLDGCQPGFPENMVRGGIISKKLNNFFCGFPISDYLTNTTKQICMETCIQALGCQSFNFRPTDGSSANGNCAIVAPSGADSINVPDSSQPGWEFYTVE